MGRVRLRTKFLIAMLLTSAGLTAISLLIVQQVVESHIRRELSRDLATSVDTFRNVQKEREVNLARSTKLMSDQPVLRALMTSRDAPTIQNASEDLFRLSGGDLLALLDTSDKLVGFHARPSNVLRDDARRAMEEVAILDGRPQWWFIDNHLYEIFLEPIYFGPESANSVLGTLALGREVNEQMAREIGGVAASDVAIFYGTSAVVSTLSPATTEQLVAQRVPSADSNAVGLKLGKERFVAASVVLNPGEAHTVSVMVLKSYDQATSFLHRLRQMLLIVGLGAVLLGSILVYVTAKTFTRPLETLVNGVRALGSGDFHYALPAEGSIEISELTRTFIQMRATLLDAQKRLLESERLATIGRMASSISHDLRHPLTAVLANAEFLADAELTPRKREEFYLEIRFAVNRLTDLIDSLLELSRPANALNVSEAEVEQAISRAIELICAHPEYQKTSVSIDSPGIHHAHFDPRKLERALYNLLLNSCQAVHDRDGHVAVFVEEDEYGIDIRIMDDGPGVEASIRDTMFQPFVSHGKENGTGLGLTIAQKIVQDHDGQLQLLKSEPGCTVMRIVLPRATAKKHIPAVEKLVGDR